MVFAVISLAPGLTGADRARAIAAAPPRTDSPAAYDTLLAQTGFDLLMREDVSAGFARITRLDLRAYESRAERVTQVMGAQDYAARLALRRDRVTAIEAGLLRREIFLVRPG